MRINKFAFAAFVLLIFSLSARAGDKTKADIQINQTLHVGSTQLDPGEYKMTWTLSGSNAEVTFSQGKKLIATVPAQATRERNAYASPAVLVDGPSNTLVEVLLPELSLSFTSKSAAPAKAGN